MMNTVTIVLLIAVGVLTVGCSVLGLLVAMAAGQLDMAEDRAMHRNGAHGQVGPDQNPWC
jgi:hypothetical protein